MSTSICAIRIVTHRSRSNRPRDEPSPTSTPSHLKQSTYLIPSTSPISPPPTSRSSSESYETPSSAGTSLTRMRASAMKAYRPACSTICHHPQPQPFRALAYSVCQSRPRTHSVRILLLSGPPQLVYIYYSNFFYTLPPFILSYFMLLPRSAPLFTTFTSLLRQSYLSLVSCSFFSSLYYCVYIFSLYLSLYLLLYIVKTICILYVKHQTGSYPMMSIKTDQSINQSISLVSSRLVSSSSRGTAAQALMTSGRRGGTAHSERVVGEKQRPEHRAKRFTARGTAVDDRMPALRACSAPQRSVSPIGRLLHCGASEQPISCRCCARAVVERPMHR